MTTRGRCLCGKTRWAYEGEVTWACYCHCDDCRRNCAAPLVAWLGVPLRNFRWSGEAPKTYESSNGVRRHFCATCGSPMGFEADHYPGGMHLYAASLEDPRDFAPTFHVNYQSKLPWLQFDDDLPKYDGTLLQAPENLRDYDPKQPWGGEGTGFSLTGPRRPETAPRHCGTVAKQAVDPSRSPG